MIYAYIVARRNYPSVLVAYILNAAAIEYTGLNYVYILICYAIEILKCLGGQLLHLIIGNIVSNII
jgi:hypothetical protein